MVGIAISPGGNLDAFLICPSQVLSLWISGNLSCSLTVADLTDCCRLCRGRSFHVKGRSTIFQRSSTSDSAPFAGPVVKKKEKNSGSVVSKRDSAQGWPSWFGSSLWPSAVHLDGR